MSTFVAFGEALVKRSVSISYFKTLKHSNLSSRNSAYVRAHAEQSQATRKLIKFVKLTARIKKCVH